MKKILSLMLCLACAAFALPVMAEETLQEDIFTYTISGGNATIIDVNDSRAQVVIPDKLDGHTVTALADGACGGSSVMQEIILPDTITSIGSLCFAYSSSLRSVQFPSQLRSIADRAFYQCESLWTATLPEGLQSIGTGAFGLCAALTAATLPESVQSIGTDAFPDADWFRIYAKEGSTAQRYALENGIRFEEYITVTVNGEQIIFDQPCITNTEHYRTMVPMRAVLEALNAEVSWDQTFNTAGITVANNRLLIRPGEPFMMVNGSVRYLSCPAIEFNGRVMLPIRDVIEAIGGKVVWNEAQKLVTVTCTF